MPPNGRVAKPTAYVMSARRTPLRGSTPGKKTRSNTSAAADAKTKKSYHSMSEPIELEISRVRVLDTSWGALADNGRREISVGKTTGSGRVSGVPAGVGSEADSYVEKYLGRMLVPTLLEELRAR